MMKYIGHQGNQLALEEKSDEATGELNKLESISDDNKCIVNEINYVLWKLSSSNDKDWVRGIYHFEEEFTDCQSKVKRIIDDKKESIYKEEQKRKENE